MWQEPRVWAEADVERKKAKRRSSSDFMIGRFLIIWEITKDR
jgi:hypothetical protein